MEIGSSGAGSLGQVAPTQTGSVQQVSRAQPAVLETPAPQESQPPPPQDQRVGTLVDVSV